MDALQVLRWSNDHCCAALPSIQVMISFMFLKWHGCVLLFVIFAFAVLCFFLILCSHFLEVCFSHPERYLILPYFRSLTCFMCLASLKPSKSHSGQLLFLSLWLGCTGTLITSKGPAPCGTQRGGRDRHNIDSASMCLTGVNSQGGQGAGKRMI